jgi:uncharacterized damage-inducible protein DinB
LDAARRGAYDPPFHSEGGRVTDDLRYPVGTWTRETSIDAARRAALIDQIARAPGQLSAAVAALTDPQLDTPYRPGGWTVRQVVHHVPDSHMNGYIRCKLGVTEASPTIKTYEENAWAQLSDVAITPVSTSLALLAAVHARWVGWLRTLDASAFARTVRHPEHGPMSVDDIVSLYAWHGRHHTAHITSLAARMGWDRS